MNLEEKIQNLKKTQDQSTIPRITLQKYATMIDVGMDEVVDFVKYWKKEGDFDGVKAYITSRVENSLTARIKQSIVKQKEENNGSNVRNDTNGTISS